MRELVVARLHLLILAVGCTLLAPSTAGAQTTTAGGSTAVPPAAEGEGTTGDEAAAERPSLGDAFRDGEFSLSLHYRYEHVDQDTFDDPARASTLRTTIGYRTQPFRGFGLALQAEDVHSIGNDLYDNSGFGSLHNGVRDRPVVADPELTELNEAYLYYAGFERSELQVGRVTLDLDNQRFVGAVGWRQNHQSFDGATATIGALEGWKFHYSYLDRQRTPTGAEIDMASHLLQIGFDSMAGKVVGYGYLLDFENEPQARSSTATFGARLTGSRKLRGVYSLSWEAELASQRDYTRNPGDYRLDYRHLVLGGDRSGWGLRAGWEVLEGDGTDAFRTPLGTNHRFNGFADLFLVTPALGLEDLYARVSWAKGSWSSLLDYHNFDADLGGARYGTEWDVQVAFTTRWKQQIALKGAFYDARDFGADTAKVWLWSQWSL